jgi:hemoglobin
MSRSFNRVPKFFSTLSLAGALALPLAFTAGCESDGSDAEPVAPVGQTTPNSLYQRIGGEPVLRKVVDDYFARMTADPSLQFTQRMQQQGSDQRIGANCDLPQLKQRYFNFIASAIGGPQEYKGEPIAQAHEGMRIDREEFQRGLKHFQDAMNANNVPQKEQDELMKVLRGARPAVVDQKNKQSS